jgi:hypothetical protein
LTAAELVPDRDSLHRIVVFNADVKRFEFTRLSATGVFVVSNKFALFEIETNTGFKPNVVIPVPKSKF